MSSDWTIDPTLTEWGADTAFNVESRIRGPMHCKFPSRKSGRMVDCLRQLEGDFCVLLEMSPNVLAFRLMVSRARPLAQPGRSSLRYFELMLDDGSVQLAVLPTEDRPAYGASPRAAARWGSDLPAIDEIAASSVRQEPRLQNLRRLAQYLPAHLPRPEACRLTVDQLHREGARSMRDAASVVGPAKLAALFAAGYAWCALDCPLHGESAVRCTTQKYHDWFFVSEPLGY